jgi:hypothetical protein
MFGDRTQPGNVPEAMAFITELRERRLLAVFLQRASTSSDHPSSGDHLSFMRTNIDGTV